MIRKMMGILLALTFVFTMCLSVGCEMMPADPNADNDSSSKIAIVENGTSNYIIVTPNNPSDTMTTAATKFQTRIKNDLNVTIPIVTDSASKGSSYSSKNKILFGVTSYSDSTTALNNLPNEYSYSVTISGKNVVFCAEIDAQILTAVNKYLISFSSYYSQASNTLYIKPFSYTSTATGEGYKSANLLKYSIVYPNGNEMMQSVAEYLAEQLSPRNLPVYSDSSANFSEYEILVGKTNRQVSIDAYESNVRLMEYKVYVSDAYVQLVINGGGSAIECVDYLSTNVFNSSNKNLSAGEHFLTSVLKDKVSISTGAVRIMTANILSDQWSEGYDSAELRAERFAAVLYEYEPDVVGMQEYDEDWDQYLPYYLNLLKTEYNLEYTNCLNKINNMQNYTSLLYRSDKFEITASGYEIFDWWLDPIFSHTYHMRNVSYAKLTDKDTSKTFIIANTHWSFNSEHVGDYLSNSSKPITNSQLKQQCASETASVISMLKSTYSGTPIFFTGDFNTAETSLNSYGATIIGNNACEHLAAYKASTQSYPIDHILGVKNTGYTLISSGQVNTTNIRKLSDHDPSYIDVAI